MNSRFPRSPLRFAVGTASLVLCLCLSLSLYCSVGPFEPSIGKWIRVTHYVTTREGGHMEPNGQPFVFLFLFVGLYQLFCGWTGYRYVPWWRRLG